MPNLGLQATSDEGSAAGGTLHQGGLGRRLWLGPLPCHCYRFAERNDIINIISFLPDEMMMGAKQALRES
jgi:hypothetical protein